MSRVAAVLAALPSALLADLRSRYAEPWRGYHDWRHIEEMLAQIGAADREAPFVDIEATVLAALFHDAVLVPLAHDNEEASAKLAGELLGPAVPHVDHARVARLIRLTAAHGKLGPGDVDADEARFLDADLAIVASEPERFAAYEAGVAKEYEALPAELFAAGRRTFLRGLLEKPALFLSPFFRLRLDAAARANLRRAVGDAG